MEKKEKVVILTAGIGGGHNAKAQALHDMLIEQETHRDICIIDIFSKILYGSNIYLFCYKNQFWFLMKIVLIFKKAVNYIYGKLCYKYLEKKIILYQPDLIINTTPMFSQSLLKISKKIKATFVIAPSDFNYMDFKYWGVPFCEKNFEYWIPYAFQTEKDIFEEKQIKTRITGFIVDKDFALNLCERKINNRNFATFGGVIPSEKVIKTCFNKFNFDPILCVPNTTNHDYCFRDITIHKFSHQEIAQLMYNSEHFILSTGGGTMNELLYTITNRKPCVLKYYIIVNKKRLHALYWERANLLFIKKFLELENITKVEFITI